MSTAELTAFNIFRKELNLSDESATKLIEAIEELQDKKTKDISTEYRSIFKDDLYKIEISIRNEMSNNTKWIVGLMFGMALMIVGLYLKK